MPLLDRVRDIRRDLRVHDVVTTVGQMHRRDDDLVVG